ncbi:MAG: N-acetyltransferase [Paracoccus sp. (in: a-proteobacteria)]|nr:N-acetyltransferase [Paracoccus sp. (in: a-proteobacteria)]
MYEICPETRADTPEVEALYDLCFAPGRTALSSYRLRDGVSRVADLCLILRSDGVLMAAIRYWPVRVAGLPVLLLGPIAVHPTAQGEGLGGLLMRDSLARATRMGFDRVLLVGDAPYYSRFGFQRLDDVLMPPPTNPDRVLGLELRPDAWVGVTGDVERETSDISASLPEPDRDACVEIEDPKEAAHDTANASGSSAHR